MNMEKFKQLYSKMLFRWALWFIIGAIIAIIIKSF
jgi:hypothetical protein